MGYRNKNKCIITWSSVSESNANTVRSPRRGEMRKGEKGECKGRIGKHTALLLRAPPRSMRSMAGLPRGSGTLRVSVSASAAMARSRGRRWFPFPRARRRRLPRGSGRASRTTSDWLWSVTHEREAQPRLLGKRFQGRSPSFNSREVSRSAFSLFLLPVNTHGSGLLHLLDALITYGLIVEQGSTHLRQPSVDGRRQWGVTWPAVRVIRFPKDFRHPHVEE